MNPAALTRELVARKSCVAILARFSRLVCDGLPLDVSRESCAATTSETRGANFVEDDTCIRRRILEPTVGSVCSQVQRVSQSAPVEYQPGLLPDMRVPFFRR